MYAQEWESSYLVFVPSGFLECGCIGHNSNLCSSEPFMSTTLAGFNALPLPIFQLSLAAVLNCGQSFRWTSYPLFLKSGDSDSLPSNDVPAFEYRYCLKDRIVCLRQTTDTLYYRAVYPNHAGHISSGKIDPGNAAKRDAETVAFIRDYFQLHLNLSNLYDEWSRRDPVFRALRDRFSGIRVLRQDPWECLISCVWLSNCVMKIDRD